MINVLVTSLCQSPQGHMAISTILIPCNGRVYAEQVADAIRSAERGNPEYLRQSAIILSENGL